MRTARERDGRAPGGAGGGGSGRRAAPARPRACTTEPTIGLPSPDRQQKHSNSSRSEERRTQRGFPSAHRASSIEQRSQAQLPSPSAEASTGRAPFAQRTPFFGPKQLRPAHDHTTPSLAHSPNDHRTTNYLPALPGDDEPQRAIERRQKVKVHAIAAKRRKLPSAEIRKASVKSATAQCDDFQTFQQGPGLIRLPARLGFRIYLPQHNCENVGAATHAAAPITQHHRVGSIPQRSRPTTTHQDTHTNYSYNQRAPTAV